MLWQVLCVARSRAVPVTVALSIPSSEQKSINAYLRSPGTPADRQQLLSRAFWRRTWQDGRSNESTVETLEHIRSGGVPVMVLAADVNLTGNPRQAQVAMTLLHHRRDFPERVIVAMLSLAMTKKTIGLDTEPLWDPVGSRLNAMLPEFTHSYDVVYDSGTHWLCKIEHGSSDHLRCGRWWLESPNGSRISPASRPRFVSYGRLSPDGFDGYYDVAEPLKSALPAVESRRRDEGNAYPPRKASKFEAGQHR